MLQDLLLGLISKKTCVTETVSHAFGRCHTLLEVGPGKMFIFL